MPLPTTNDGNGNGRHNRKQWWHHLPIPESWYVDEEEGRNRYIGDRRSTSSDLDDTRSGYRRRYDDDPPLPSFSSPRIQIPLPLVVTIIIYLIGQLIGGIWWAATQQSNLQHEIADRAKEEARLWDGLQTYRAENNALRLEVARLTGNSNRNRDPNKED